MEPISLIIIVIALVLSAIFSGSEMAFITTDKMAFEMINQKNSYQARILRKFNDDPSRFIATILIGNTLSLVVYGIFMEHLLAPYLKNYFPSLDAYPAGLLFIQTLIATAIVLVLAEFIPKSIFTINPLIYLKLFTPFLHLVYLVLQPLVFICMFLSKFFVRYILNQNYQEAKHVLGLVDLNNYLKKRIKTTGEQGDEIHESSKILTKTIDFTETNVRDVLIPRTDIDAIDLRSSIEELKKAFIESGHSKILIYDKSIDNIIGYCHSMNLFNKPKSISNILTPINIVPGTMSAKDLMLELIRSRKSIALVVDEYGGTSGIASLEDAIEEIFGEIEDEHDGLDLVEKEISKKEYIFSARHEIDYLNEKYNFNLPQGEYETLGGLIMSLNEEISEEGTVIDLEDIILKVISKEDHRLNEIRLIFKEND